MSKEEDASEDATWKRHLVTERCPAAIVRISTNAKARISILRAKQPHASKVIIEEEDEEDNEDTVGRQPTLTEDVDGENLHSRADSPPYVDDEISAGGAKSHREISVSKPGSVSGMHTNSDMKKQKP